MDTQTAGTLSDHGLRPIKDQVLVRQSRPREQLESGLYVSDSAARELQEDTAEVLAIGPKVLDVAAGDHVIFKRRADSALIPDRLDLKLEGTRREWEDLLMLRESDILLVIED